MNNPQKQWVMVRQCLLGESKVSYYDSHTKAKRALHYALKEIRENYLDENVYIKCCS